jgi:hypothetical protein
MHSILFWKDWPRVYQQIFRFVAIIFFFSLSFLWFSWFQAPAPALTWQFVEEQEVKEVPVHHFQIGAFDLTINADNYLIFERLLGSDLVPGTFSSYLLVALLATMMIMILSVITTLTRFWYFAGAGLFILFIASLRLEILQVFGRSDKVFTIAILLIFIPVSYYLNAVKNSVSFLNRLLIFLFLTTITGLIIYFFSSVPKPFLHLSVTAVAPALVLTAIFIITVSHEILASFVTAISSGLRPSKSLNHFLIISVIYFLNLALAYAHKFNFIHWDFLYINFLLLLSVSGVLGVWGFRQRQPQFEGIADAEPFGVYFFLSLGLTAFGTIGYLIANANDPGLESINDFIIFCHLGYGIIFFTYIIANFFDLLGNNLPVFKVLYKPARMPYFTFRFGGLIATLAFLFYNTWQVPVKNAISTYYNAGGDLYRSLGNTKLAHGFYEQAGTYGFLNHHSNYAIANIESGKWNTDKERAFYRRATERRPTNMAFLNYAETYQREQNWLQALLVLREADKAMPNDGAIQNTIGIVYSKLTLLDSAYFFFQKAEGSNISKNAAKTNIIALAAQNNFQVSSDSLYAMLGSTQPGVQANALAFANQQREKIEMNIDLDKDTTLNLFSSTLISNYLVNHLGETDSSFIAKAIRLGERKSNSSFSEPVLFSSALALYADGQVEKAFTQLEKIIFSSNNQGKYNNILALWALEQEEPRAAIPYLEFSINQGYNPAHYTLAVATAEAESLNPSLILWDSLRKSNDSVQLALSNSMMRVLTVTPAFVSKLNDADKYAYCRYRISAADTAEFLQQLNTIQNDDYKAKAILDFSKKLYAADETLSALKIFSKLKNIKFGDEHTHQEVIHFQLLLLAQTGDLTTLSQQLENGITFEGYRKNEKIYFTTLIDLARGENAKINQNFKWLSSVNPFFDDAIVTSAIYFKAHSADKLKAYNILVNAIQRHPHSVKITKAYCLESAKLGFDEYRNTALERLQAMLPANAYQAFIQQNRTVLTAQSN